MTDRITARAVFANRAEYAAEPPRPPLVQHVNRSLRIRLTPRQRINLFNRKINLYAPDDMLPSLALPPIRDEVTSGITRN